MREPASPDANHEYLRLPCGNCIGCRQSKAREWAFRCSLELQAHDQACWATLTYDDWHLPPTLVKEHLSAYIKRLRARVEPRTVRFFGSGEYGERTERPHYHVILFGLPRDETAIRDSWTAGHVRVDPLTPAAINYVAGYTSKKAGRRYRHYVDERIDLATGEVYLHVEPFLLMSRRPGIGGHARQYHTSWRDSAIHNGDRIPVPRYLHQAWVKNTSPEQHEKLNQEKKTRHKTDSSPERLKAAAEIASSKQRLKTEKRKLA